MSVLSSLKLMNDCNHIYPSSIAFSCFGDTSVFPAVECRTTFPMGNRWQLVVFLLTLDLFLLCFLLLSFSLSFSLFCLHLFLFVLPETAGPTMLWENKHGCRFPSNRATQTLVASLCWVNLVLKGHEGEMFVRQIPCCLEPSHSRNKSLEV